MRLRASCELTFENPCTSPFVVMLRPRRSGQRIVEERIDAGPRLDVTSFVDLFGNRCDRIEAPPGPLHVRSTCVVEVPASVAAEAEAPRTPFTKLPAEALHFTLPSRYCPSDRVQARAREVTAGCRPGYAEVQAIRDHVHAALTYEYGVSDSSTDALETLQVGRGVCRDFAHVAISLCRSIDIPARMVVGYLHERAPMDLHAWFEAHVGGRWYTFDPSEETLRGGRVVIAHGRDAADVAFVTDYGAMRLTSMQVGLHADPVRCIVQPKLRAAG